jgi:restriction endonuclease S subunit
MWKTVKLGDVAKFVRGLTYSKKDEVDTDGIPVLRATNIDLATHKIVLHEIRYISKSVKVKDDKYAKQGDLLVCTASGSKSHLGKVALVEDDIEMAFGGFMAALRCSYECHPKYLYHVLTSSHFKHHLASLSDGANINNLKYSQIEYYSFALPPIAEQQRIVAKLDAAFAEIDNAIEVANVKKVELDKLKDRTLATLLKGNEQMSKTLSLGDSSTFISRGISPKYIEKGGICVLNQKCVRNHKVNYEFSRRHNIEIKKVSEERFIRKGDLLINSTGQGTLGRVAQVKEEPEEITTVDSHVTIVRPRHELFYPSYFGYAAISIEKLIKSAGQGTSGQTELAKSAVQNDFQITFPICHDEQKNIVDKLNQAFKQFENALNKNKEIQTNYLSLKSAILKQELQSSEAA